MLVRQERQRRVVARCCERCLAAGVRAGMPVAQATALFGVSGDRPPPRVEPYRPDRDAASLRRLAMWAHRLCPIVAIDDAPSEAGPESAPEPDGLLLDVSGCGHVFGDEAGLMRRAIAGLRELGFCARAAIAPSFGCAWALARYGPDAEAIVGPLGVRDALRELPVAALRVPREVVGHLAEIGIDRVGQLLELPRAAIPPRFGGSVLLRLDQAMGHALEPITPIKPERPVSVERLFDGPTTRAEPIERAVRDLLDELAAELGRRESGVRSLAVELARSDLDSVVLSVTLGRPTRDPRRLWHLIRPRLERAHLGFGVEAVTLRAGMVSRVRYTQQAAWTDGTPADDAGIEAHASAEAVGELIDTLGNRLGVDRVLRASLAESHVPERSFAMAPAAFAVPTGPVGITPNDRPTMLLDQPQPVEVMALTPDGPVHRVQWNGVEHTVTRCVGPERVGHEWWRAAGSTRDYFAVHDDRGRWLWVARSVESGKWFVHGVWA